MKWEGISTDGIGIGIKIPKVLVSARSNPTGGKFFLNSRLIYPVDYEVIQSPDSTIANFVYYGLENSNMYVATKNWQGCIPNPLPSPSGSASEIHFLAMGSIFVSAPQSLDTWIGLDSKGMPLNIGLPADEEINSYLQQ